MRHPASFDFCPMSWRVCSRVLLALSLLAGLGWLCWKGARDAAIPLLPPGPGEWIVYPTPPQSGAYLGQAVSADFERQFVLGTPPAQAELSWRAFRQSGLSINGIALPEAGQAGRNWKDVSRMDAAPYLRRGTNTISATVWNDNGPPALSLRLEIHGAAVATDEGWGVSVAGAAWRPARPAAATPEFGEGNALHGLEETGPALRESRARLCVFLLVASGLAGGLAHGMRRGAGAGGWNYWRWPALGLAAAWAVLFLHNSPLLPRDTGFDAPEHLKYISYVQEHRSLPAPDQGWEMYQPPLYYVLSACLLGVCHLDVSQPAGILLLRWWGALAGAANVALIFFCLRLIFPGQWTRQMAGALLAAFLPAQIYLLHYTTNETLAATLMSGAFYCCLRILRAPAAAAGWHAGLGCVLGLALLAKASAVLFLPVIFAVVAGKLILERQTAPGLWVRTVGLAGFFVLLAAGWRYAQVWRDYGSPLAGNWDARVITPWWQHPGYHTAGYFLSFGRALTAPLFSGFHSFWDSFYTTLWGDGLAGGRTSIDGLPPWNYGLMDAGFLLAIVPSALVLTGLTVAVARCLREPDLVFLLLVGAAGSAGFAMLFMSMKLAFYAQSKCFYGLPALLPFCVCGVLGLDFWARRGRGARAVLALALFFWLVNVYATFWIHPHSLQTEVSAAVADFYYGNDDRATGRAVERVLRADPANETGLVIDALLRGRQEGPGAAAERLRRALRQHPKSGEIVKFLAPFARDLGETNEAAALAARAFALEPESPQAGKQACDLALQARKNQEALEAGRAALGLEPGDETVQFDVGCAWANLGHPAEAIRQFQMLLALKPSPPMEADAHFYLGRLLAGQPGGRAAAMAHYQAALLLDPANAACREALAQLR